MTAQEEFRVVLSPDLARDLRESVAAGAFASVSEAMQDAVRVWQHHRREDAGHLEKIRRRIRQSLDDPRASLTLAQVDELLAARYAKAGNAGSHESS